MRLRPVVVVLGLLVSFNALSQEMDPIYQVASVKKDSVYRKFEHQVTGPKKSVFLAGMLSLVVPGAGQLYNGQFKSAVFYLAANVGCNVIMRSAAYDGENDLKNIAFLSGLAINVLSVVDACNQAARINYDRGYQSGLNLRVAPYISRNPDYMAATGGGRNNYGLSVNLEF